MTDPGYDFVPLPERVHRAKRPHATHDRHVQGTTTAKLSITLVAEQPLHVGSGFKTVRDQQVVRAAVTTSGIPCIPGSTLKGVLRSRYEAITRSCALFSENGRPVKIRSSSFPGAQACFTGDVTSRGVFHACNSDEVCAACALFGRMSFRGRVIVSDFVPRSPVVLQVAEVAEMFSPNLHHVGRFNPTTPRGNTVLEVLELHGRKFACGRGPETKKRQLIEVIPVGSVLSGDLRVINATPAELGGLFAALGIRPRSHLKLGAGKGHGYGRVRVDGLAVCLRAGSKEDEAEYERQFRASSDAWVKGLDALVRIHALDGQP